MAIPRSESKFSGDDVNAKYSSELATSVRDGTNTFETVSGRQYFGQPQERPSLVRVVKMFRHEDIEKFNTNRACESNRFVISDRIRFSIRAKDATGPGDFDVEIHSVDGVSARLVFRGRFNFNNVLSSATNNMLEAWLVTITGDPCHEWVVGVSFEPEAGAQPDAAPPKVAVQAFAIADRAGSCPSGSDGSTSPSIQVNREALVDVTTPTPEQAMAKQLSILNPAYTPAVPDAVVPFVPDTISFAFTTAAAAEVWVSFDGVTDHVHMVNGTPTSSFTMPSHKRSWWVRAVAGAPVPLQFLATQDRDFF